MKQHNFLNEGEKEEEAQNQKKKNSPATTSAVVAEDNYGGGGGGGGGGSAGPAFAEIGAEGLLANGVQVEILQLLVDPSPRRMISFRGADSRQMIFFREAHSRRSSRV